ncbi:hypothetical protein ID853_11240, partial [Xenorhabdus sp. Vera]|nr:hypothetical protein [Xenorhabdus sp. Vera]
MERLTPLCFLLSFCLLTTACTPNDPCQIDKTSFSTCLKLANQGNAEAQSYIGYLYHFGLGVTQDYKEAVKWYNADFFLKRQALDLPHIMQQNFKALNRPGKLRETDEAAIYWANPPIIDYLPWVEYLADAQCLLLDDGSQPGCS